MDFDLMTVVAPGWLELRLPRADGAPEPPRVLVRSGQSGGRAVITAVIVVGDVLDSQTLKSVPVARIESALNHPEHGIPLVSLDTLTDEQRREFAERDVLFFDEFAGIDGALDRYLAAAKPNRTEGRRVFRRRPRPKLTRPDGRDPEAFYRLVAEAYNDLAATTSKPAPILAEEAGVPVPTVHRWIAEARRRGHLPPARKGRAG